MNQESKQINIISIISIVFAVVLFLLGESLIVILIAFLGTYVAIIVFAAIGISINSLVLSIYFNHIHYSWLQTRVSNMVQRLVKKYNRHRVARFASFSFTLFVNIIIGPISTSLLMALAGVKEISVKRFAILNNVIFSAVWVGIYSGFLRGINLFIVKSS